MSSGSSNFGTELECILSAHPDWRDHSIPYNKLLGILNSLSSSAALKSGVGDGYGHGSAGSSHVSVKVPLIAKSASRGGGSDDLSTTDDDDFMDVYRSSISRVNAHVEDVVSGLRGKIDDLDRDIAAEVSLVGPATTKGSDRSILKSHVQSVYEELTQLQNYCEVNLLACQSLLRHWDNILGESRYADHLRALQAEPFQSIADKWLPGALARVRKFFSALFSSDEFPYALFYPQQRKTFASEDTPTEPKTTYVWKPTYIILAFLLGAVIMSAPILAPDQRHAHNCLAVVATITVLWVTEALPFFVSGLLVVPLSVMCSVIPASVFAHYDPETDNYYEMSAKYLLGGLFDDTLGLILGGFAIASACAKVKFDVLLSSVLLRRVSSPKWLLLAMMTTGWFLSFWIGNVVASVFTMSIFMPVLSRCPRDSKFVKGSMIAIAFSNNIGGMMTPIASPQNAIATGIISSVAGQNISFITFMSVTVPYGIILLLLLWLYFIHVWKIIDVRSIPSIDIPEQRMTLNHIVVLFVSFATVMLWVASSFVPSIFGSLGCVGLVPLIIFCGTGILSQKADLGNFAWNIILLVAGGHALGTATQDSTLLDIIVAQIEKFLHGKTVFFSLVIFLLFVGLVTCFVSHTVSAIIMMPIIAKVGDDYGHVQMFVILCVLMTSGSMVLPVTSFPNVNSLLVTDKKGKPYLSVSDFLLMGTPVTVFILVYTIFAGYGITLMVGL